MKTSRALILVWCCALPICLRGEQAPAKVDKPADEPATKAELRLDKALIGGEQVNNEQLSGRTARIADDNAMHEELRVLRVALTEAVKKGDVEGQLAHVDNNIVATWQNNRVVRGTDGLRNFLKEMNTANEKVFRGYKVEPEADELTILHGGDVGIVFGKSVPQYHYLGMDFELENRWTATIVKQDGKWKIAAYHVSGNIVDNPVLSIAKRSAYWAGGICLVLGVLVGTIGSAALRRRPQPQA